MPEPARLAVYYAPPAGSALHRFGAAWLGRDAETGEVPPPPDIPGLPAPRAEMVATPARYGFHATLKPPFVPVDGATADDVIDAAATLAAGLRPFTAPPLRLEAGPGFLWLRLSAPSPEMDALAEAAVTGLDALRAPPSEAELARRRARDLSEAEAANLANWGYPYVLDRFRFHMTLTGPLDPPALEAVRAALAPIVAPLRDDPLPVREIAVFADPGGGAPFRLIRRLPLGG